MKVSYKAQKTNKLIHKQTNKENQNVNDTKLNLNSKTVKVYLPNERSEADALRYLQVINNND